MSIVEGGPVNVARDVPTTDTVVSPTLQQTQSIFTDLLVDLDLDPAADAHQQHVQMAANLLHGRPRPTPKKAQSGELPNIAARK